MEEASIFLQGHQKGGELMVTSDTLAALFTLQYCQNPAVSVILVEPRKLTQSTCFNLEEKTHGNIHRELECTNTLGEHGEEHSSSLGECEHSNSLTYEQRNHFEHSNNLRECEYSNGKFLGEHEQKNITEHEHSNNLGECEQSNGNSLGEHEQRNRLREHEHINNTEHKHGNNFDGLKHSNSHQEYKEGSSRQPSDAGALRDDCIFPVDPGVLMFKYSVLEEKDCPSVLSNCVLPAAILNSEPVWCVAGLCSTLRFMLHRTVDGNPQHHAAHLLGFRRSCLQACAEVSVWTKFCEVEALRALREVAVNGCVKFHGQGELGNADKEDKTIQGKGEINNKTEGRCPELGETERDREGVEEAEESASAKVKDKDREGVEQVEESEQMNENDMGGVEKVEESVEMNEKHMGGVKEVELSVEVKNRIEGCIQKGETKSRVAIAAELVRYERHLQRPPLLHNALKTKHQYIRETVQDKAERDRLLQLPLAQLPDIEHKYAEGLKMTLADVLLFVSFHILITKLQSLVTLAPAIPLVLKWHKVILENKYVKGALPVLSNALALICSDVWPDFPLEAVIPDVPDESIYKSDPERYKPRWRSFTHQEDIDVVLGMVDDKDVEMGYKDHPAGNISLPWSSLPPSVNPKEGKLPPSRLERKCQQLENVVMAVESVAQDGNIIVDFCAGGGHVGIILAYRLPKCKIVLVENKEASLIRAKERIDTLKLKNVVFVQCNLDYFRGRFNVGVCLHACGVATDLVLLKCMEQCAAFVCSPCCYGGVQANHILTYPRSKAYCNIPLRQDQYITLGHAADQTHDQNNPKTSQGQRCMRLVDSDRLKAAQEIGYSTTLTLMQPPHCSPKNHLLIGVLGS